MLVKNILALKGSDVATIEPTVPLSAAVAMLAQKRIGALLVTGAQRHIVGIVSERDIVRAIAEGGVEALDKPVAETMTRKVITCSLDTTVSDIMETMTHNKIRHVPVETGGQLAGVISIGDVVKSRIEEMSSESDQLKDYIRAG